jgi:hypothetical protein
MQPIDSRIEWQCFRCGRWVPLDEAHVHAERRVVDRRMGGDRRKGERRRESDRRQGKLSSVLLEPRH